MSLHRFYSIAFIPHVVLCQVSSLLLLDVKHLQKTLNPAMMKSS
jgi:hypothetical protein